jgi:hypothetical protein
LKNLKTTFGIHAISNTVIERALKLYISTNTKTNKTNKTNKEILEEIAAIQRTAFTKENYNSLDSYISTKTNKTNKEILEEIKAIQRTAFTKENYNSKFGNASGGKKKKGIKRKPAVKRKPKPTGKKKVRKIHKGPKGGRYYISKGRKVYI